MLLFSSSQNYIFHEISTKNYVIKICLHVQISMFHCLNYLFSIFPTWCTQWVRNEYSFPYSLRVRNEYIEDESCNNEITNNESCAPANWPINWSTLAITGKIFPYCSIGPILHIFCPLTSVKTIDKRNDFSITNGNGKWFIFGSETENVQSRFPKRLKAIRLVSAKDYKSRRASPIYK